MARRTSGRASAVAIVTGANHGIGAATARALAADGARVLVAGLAIVEERDPAIPDAYYAARRTEPHEVASAITSAGGAALGVSLDLATDGATQQLFDRAEDHFGAPVRILVHNATAGQTDTFAAAQDHADAAAGRRLPRVSPSTIDPPFAVDARAGALLIAEFAQRHLERGDDWGRIVTLSSGGPGGFPTEASYGAAKAALDNYAMTAAAELGHLGVTVNALMPPVTDTGWVNDAVREFVASSHEHHHVATPDEVAAVVAHLCSDAAWLVTGNRIVLR